MELSGENLHATQDAVIEGNTYTQQDLFVGGDLTVDGRINLKTTGIEENLEIDGLLIVKSFVDISLLTITVALLVILSPKHCDICVFFIQKHHPRLSGELPGFGLGA